MVIFMIIGAIIFVINASFERIDRSLSTTINQDVNQAIENAQLNRELHRIFTRTTLFMSTLHENEASLQETSSELLDSIQAVLSAEMERSLQAQVREFSEQLTVLVNQKRAILSHFQQLQSSDGDLFSLLAKLEDQIAQKLIMLTMENKDLSPLTQISALIPSYRDLLRQITIKLMNIRQETTGSQCFSNPEDAIALKEQYPELFALFQDIGLQFRILLASEQDIAQYGEELFTALQTYETHVNNFFDVVQETRQVTLALKDLQSQLHATLKAKDSEIAQTSGKLQNYVASVIGKARSIILALTVVLLLILTIGWLITRWMTRPLTKLSQSATQLATGDLACDIPTRSTGDEIGSLSLAFKQLMAYFQEMAVTAAKISHGNFDLEIRPRSEKDVFGTRFQQMVHYLKDIADLANKVAHGDLRKQVMLRSEHDQLGSVFSRMQQGLIALITEIRSGADYISSVSQHVLSTASENSDALQKIGTAAEVTSSAMQEVNASAEEVRMNSEQLSSSVEQTSASISEMITSISHVAENSRKLTEFTETTSSTVAHIVTALEKVAQQTEQSESLSAATTEDAASGQQSVEQMVAKMQAISQMTQDISDIIQRLEQRSTDIGRILEVIDDVADQTSMLSLNASIIAAQAGVHGRGFAVVANEIKDLAQRVGTSTNEIGSIIQRVQRDSADAASAIAREQQEVESGVVVAQQAGEALEKIRQSAQNSSKVAAENAVLIRQQTTASTRIADSISDVANMSSEITRATQEQEKNSSQLFNVVEKMQSLSLQVFRATQEQQQSTQHVTEFMEEVTGLVEQSMPTVKQLAQTADELTAQADNLKQHVERFMLPREGSSGLEGKTLDNAPHHTKLSNSKNNI